MARYTEAHKAATMRYLSTLKDVRLRVAPGKYSEWAEAAKRLEFVKDDGTANMRQFIMWAVEYAIEKEGK